MTESGVQWFHTPRTPLKDTQVVGVPDEIAREVPLAIMNNQAVRRSIYLISEGR
jgi:hypothetical protein